MANQTAQLETHEPGKYALTPVLALARARDPFITPHPLYLVMGREPDERAQAYRQWLDAGIAPDDLERLRAYVSQERALGDERFQHMVETTLGRPATCRPRGRPRRHSLHERI